MGMKDLESFTRENHTVIKKLMPFLDMMQSHFKNYNQRFITNVKKYLCSSSVTLARSNLREPLLNILIDDT